MRINPKHNKFFLPTDNEISFDYLRYIYEEAETNNNRIVVSKLLQKIPGVKDLKLFKLIHLYKFESSTSLSQYRAFEAQNGQIKELNVVRLDEKKPSSKLEMYLKKIDDYDRLADPDQVDPEADNEKKVEKRGSIANANIIQSFFAKRMTMKSKLEEQNKSNGGLSSLMALASAIKEGASKSSQNGTEES